MAAQTTAVEFRAGGARRSDISIAVDVRAAVEQTHALPPPELPALRVEVHHGVVTLRGYSSATAHRDHAIDAARGVPGVVAVKDQVVTDTEIELAVAQALGADPATEPQRIDVRSFHGVVHLAGTVPSESVRRVAINLAGRVPDVRLVLDELTTPHDPHLPPPQPIVRPLVGAEVYGADGLLGRVRRVVLDPHTRRVTALVVGGEFTYDPEFGHHVPPGLGLRWRDVVAPVELVRSTSQFSVQLFLDGAAAAALPDYDEAAYTPPPPVWRAPLDYHREEIRFARGRTTPGDADQARP